MTSVHGYYEIFDYSAFTDPVSVYPPKVDVRTYSPGSIMDAIRERHPRLTFLIRHSGLDWQLSDAQSRITLFVPPESSLDEAWVKSADKDSARKFVKYHMCMGFFPEQVLRTSPVYSMRSTIKGHDIYVETNPWGQLFLNSVPIIAFNKFATNGVMHDIAMPLTVPPSC